MGWFSKASMECDIRGYEVVNFNPESGIIHLKKDGVIIPITAEEIDRWVDDIKIVPQFDINKTRQAAEKIGFEVEIGSGKPGIQIGDRYSTWDDAMKSFYFNKEK